MSFIGILIAIVGQVFNGTVSVFDKFLLEAKLKPTVFAFWISITSLGALALLPFNFSLPAPNMWFINLSAGATFSLAVLFMYAALQREEVTRVMPVIGSLIPVFTLVIAYFTLNDRLEPIQIAAIAILSLGIIFLTYRHSQKPVNYLIMISAVMAAFAFALSSVLMKEIFNVQSFISGLAWSRLGGLIVVPLVLMDPESRNEIFRKREMPKRGNTIIFFLGRIFSGMGFLLVNFAYILLNPVIVNALQGVQYAYLFIANQILGKFWPKLFDEKLNRRTLALKIFGVVIIIVGSAILALKS